MATGAYSRTCPVCAAEPGVPCLGVKAGLIHADRAAALQSAKGRKGHRQQPHRSFVTGWCEYCGDSGAQDPFGLTRDHVIPRGRGGVRVYVSACRKCNSQRGSLPYPTYALQRGVPLARIVEVMLAALAAYEDHHGRHAPTMDEESYQALRHEPAAGDAGWRWPFPLRA